MFIEFTYHAKVDGIDRLHSLLGESVNVYQLMDDSCKSFMNNSFVDKYFKNMRNNKYRHRTCHHRATGLPFGVVFVIEIINPQYVRVINFFVETADNSYATLEFKGKDNGFNLWLYPEYFRFETPNGVQTWI